MSCRRCSTDRTRLTRDQAEVARLARIMSRARPTALPGLRTQLVDAKAQVKQTRDLIEESHECDELLSTAHWSKKVAK